MAHSGVTRGSDTMTKWTGGHPPHGSLGRRPDTRPPKPFVKVPCPHTLFLPSVSVSPSVKSPLNGSTRGDSRTSRGRGSLEDSVTHLTRSRKRGPGACPSCTRRWKTWSRQSLGTCIQLSNVGWDPAGPNISSLHLGSTHLRGIV